MSTILIADSGGTNCEWCLLNNGKKKKIVTSGISPYFLTKVQIESLLVKQLMPKLKNIVVDNIFFYGTGLGNKENQKKLKSVLKYHFPKSKIKLETDMLGAARSLCGKNKGIVCILGTGSNSCYFNGKKIEKSRPGIGFILGDEGSGAYMGRKVLQHYLYNTYDEELNHAFKIKYKTTASEILDTVYKGPLANRYLASFTSFLSENRGHFMVENIIEDSINDFFFQHLCKYKESWINKIHFAGSVAYFFKDVIKDVCNSYEMELGNIYRQPMEGLINYHLSII